MLTPNTQIQRQHEREIDALIAGAERHNERQLRKAATEGFDKRDDVQAMIRGASRIVADAIAKFITDAQEKKGRPPVALSSLVELEPEEVAVIVLSRTFGAMLKNDSVSAITISIGHAIQVELEGRALANKDPKAAKRFAKLAEGDAKLSTTLRRHEKVAEELDVDLGWTRTKRALIGGAVLNILLTSLPGVFGKIVVTDQRGTTPTIALTAAAVEYLQTNADIEQWMHPLYKPMIVQPRPWDRMDTGAYLDYRVSKTVKLVRTFSREHQNLVREAIKDGSMSEELEAINAIQNTRFAIDTRVLDMVKWVREEGHRPDKSFPLAEAPVVPAKMEKEDWDAMAPDARSAAARRRKALIDIRDAVAVDGTVFAGDVYTASVLAQEEAFWLPHNMDFRGRVYSIPHFNPQRSDHIKALFCFADTVAMGEDGGDWLRIHLANCASAKLPDGRKTDKVSFDERIAWAQENEAMILEVGRNPKGTYETWGNMDSAFCFLQAAMEYAEWADAGYSETWGGRISIALDGSCSGLQHYSAMTRSEEEGYHVNLLPRETPGDIYNVVAGAARPNLEAARDRGELLETIILAEGFGRGEVKTNVMTYFYGSGQFGMRDQHMKNLIQPIADKVALGEQAANPYSVMTVRKDKKTGEETEALDGGYSVAGKLAAYVYAAVVSVAPKADEASRWFQSVAAMLAHESHPVIWRTPTGLPVVQRYSEYENKEVNLWLYDRAIRVPVGSDKVDDEGNVFARIRCLVREAPSKRINKKKARSAISPNVVHSLDGSHLKRTAVFAAREGITHFQLIHDSFATHAGNTTRFFQIIREAFVDMYETYCPFEAVEAYARTVLSEEGLEKLTALEKPVRGTLDIRKVQDSLYAFA
jgi:DNA-directed RNA polymerase